MRAIQSDTHGNMAGNFWRVEDGDGVELMTFVAAADVTDEAGALAAYHAIVAEEEAEPVPALADYEGAIQRHVDTVARSRNFHDGFALAGYVTSTVPQWQAEAAAFVAWRDAVWLHAYAELAKVEAQQREQPTVEDFIGELPAIEWPEV